MTPSGRLPATEDLRCFVAAADELNFRRAAARVGLTPAALGQRVRQMERRLEISLFERTTRRVRLTEAGERLLPEARSTLERLRRLSEVARGPPGERHLVVAADARLDASWLLQAFDEAEERGPGWRVDLELCAPSLCAEKLSEGTADAAVVATRAPATRWTSHHVAELPFVLAASPELLASRPLRRVEQAQGHTLLVASIPSLPELPGNARFERTRSCGDWLAALELASRGRGVAHLPERVAGDALRRGVLVRVLDGLEGPPWAVCLLHSGDESVARLGSMLSAEPGTAPVG